MTYVRRDGEPRRLAHRLHSLSGYGETFSKGAGMLRGEPFDRGEPASERIPDRELGLAAVLVGVVVLLATFLVPIVG